MLRVRPTSRFKKDLKKLEKQSKPLLKLRDIINYLSKQEVLAQRHHDHALTGNYEGCRECHVTPDWLLIYEIVEPHVILVRTGSYSELFG